MDPLTPQEPNTPSTEPAQTGAGHIDLKSILLPKKETPGATVDSAQRINAGALLEQEVTAGALGTDTAREHAQEAATAAAQPIAPAAPKVEEALVKPLETYQHDIESVVQKDNVSVLSIATAEANRRAGGAPGQGEIGQEATPHTLRNIVMIAGGLVLLVVASGALAYLISRPTSVPGTNNTAANITPFISVDSVKEITVTSDEPRAQVLSSINAARLATSVSLGLMSQLLVTVGSTTGSAAALSAQDFFTFAAPHMPPSLARALQPNYLLGVHVYNGNQAFVIAGVYSYEEAYAGMLSWEPYIKGDLSPLFDYTPSPRINTVPTVTATSSDQASTTPSSTPTQFIQTGFIDKIVENHDARVLVNENGDIYLLWTFLDRNTLVITTNDATLREIISRLKSAPITPIPSAQ